MKFLIQRVSSYKDPKCSEAVKVADGEVFPVYTIEVKDLDALIALVNKYGELVIDHSASYSSARESGLVLPDYEIEIYDGYRE